MNEVWVSFFFQTFDTNRKMNEIWKRIRRFPITTASIFAVDVPWPILTNQISLKGLVSTGRMALLPYQSPLGTRFQYTHGKTSFLSLKNKEDGFSCLEEKVSLRTKSYLNSASMSLPPPTKIGQLEYPSYTAGTYVPFPLRMWIRFSTRTGVCAIAAAAVFDVGKFDESPFYISLEKESGRHFRLLNRILCSKLHS